LTSLNLDENIEKHSMEDSLRQFYHSMLSFLN
jgi:hypothetical protein